MFEILAFELRQIWKSLEDGQRRVAASQLSGFVAEIDGSKIRIELEPKNEKTGKPFLSPWVQLQEAAGITSTNMPIALGDPVRLMSPNGEIGSLSLAIRDSHTNDEPNPTDENELVIAFGDCAIRMKDGLLLLKQGDVQILLEGSETKIISTHHTHNGVNIGDDHKHRKVTIGTDISGKPL